MRRFLLAAALAAVGLVVAAPEARPQSYYDFIVVVSAENPVNALPRSAVSQLFLKKATWADGRRAVPVDQREASEVRVAFTRMVHRKSVTAIKSYWQQQIFAGREVPPAEKASDQEVLEFVRANPSAIGYVSAAADLGAGVKILNLSAD